MILFVGHSLSSLYKTVCFLTFIVICSGLSLPDSIEDYFAWAYAAGARIHSNSWGHAANTYDDYPQSIDECARPSIPLLACACALPSPCHAHTSLLSYVFSEAPDMLILFAAANSGDGSFCVACNSLFTSFMTASPQPPSSFPHPQAGGYGSASVGSPATCKNCLTVGASEGSVQVIIIRCIMHM